MTGVLIYGNTIDEWYQGNFTYAVWWDSLGGTPETEGEGGNFYKIFTNDTLGHWSEVEPIRYNDEYDLLARFDYICRMDSSRSGISHYCYGNCLVPEETFLGGGRLLSPSKMGRPQQ